ncbi:MAG: bifunctional diguanylate cyclase/phosphodiesterase [Bauldia sp.]|nr:bifunctional diguanylate cyclase/phosphodiesterase [Bauldia sp.]
MTKAMTGRITLNLLAGIAVTILAVGLALFLMSSRQNAEAGAASVGQLTRGIASMTGRAQAIAGDYAARPELVAAFANDQDRLAEGAIIPAPSREDVDDLFVVGTDGRIVYSWNAKGEANASLPQLAARAGALSRIANPFEPVAPSSFTALGSEIYLLAVAPLSLAERLAAADPARGPLVAVAVHLDAGRLAALGELAMAGDLHLEEGAGDPGSVYPLIVGIDGAAIGRFVWTLPRPGEAMLRGIVLPVGGILAAFSLFAAIVAFRTRRFVVGLIERERAATAAARTDTVTGLLNRDGFGALLETAPVAEASDRGQVGIIYLDVNGFKSVNDSIGHRGGDELIRVLADRLASVLPADAAFARIGGDEFAALLTGKNARDTIAGAAAALVHALEEPFLISGFEFHVTAAVGYAVAGRPGMRPAEILRRADLAMYQAKAASEREAVAYHASMESDALEKKRVEAALRKAIETGELTVVYQPIVRTADMTIASLEALVRWDSKEFGPIAPALFVPVAEETGLIHEVGSFVIHRACQDLASWDTDLKVSINVSPVQLRDPNFASDLLAMVERAGARPERFELELTEGILVSNPAIAKRKLETLKKLGFGLSLDDFGTGFSSIGYLRQFPFNKLKVDRSFVREIGVNPTANALIQAIVSIGDAMELAVVAEGIENEEQLSLLRLLQCEYIQGFYLSRPITAEQVTALVEAAGANRPRIALGGGARSWHDRPDALSA